MRPSERIIDTTYPAIWTMTPNTADSRLTALPMPEVIPPTTSTTSDTTTSGPGDFLKALQPYPIASPTLSPAVPCDSMATPPSIVVFASARWYAFDGRAAGDRVR